MRARGSPLLQPPCVTSGESLSPLSAEFAGVTRVRGFVASVSISSLQAGVALCSGRSCKAATTPGQGQHGGSGPLQSKAVFSESGLGASAGLPALAQEERTSARTLFEVLLLEQITCGVLIRRESPMLRCLQRSPSA